MWSIIFFINSSISAYWVVSMSWLLWMMLQWTQGRVWTSLQDNDFIPSDLHLRVELLDHVNVLIFWATSTLFSTVAAPIYIPTKSAQEFSFQEALFECKSSTVAIWR